MNIFFKTRVRMERIAEPCTL